MIATDRFIYLHLHKSGGTFVNDALLNFFPQARVIGYHLPRRMIPLDLQGLPVVGFVRNPWGYYVSWYSFQRSLPQPNALFRCLSEDGALGFKGTITNMLELGAAGGKLEQLLPLLPQTYGGRGLNLPGPVLAGIRGSGLGFYSFLYRHMFAGEGSSLYVGKTESLRDDLLSFFAQMRFAPPSGFEDYVRAQADRNTSSHGPSQDHYDAELRERVARRDAELIQSHQYRFEEAH